MNEVTKIHLGRQAFNISVAAHKALRSYIDAIAKQVVDEDVIEEVELRMAELLAESGVRGNKVVLVKDVDYLKKQLGDPKDFQETEDASSPANDSSDVKRLFRDTDNAMIAGVAAGLAQYTGINVLLIRVLFIIGNVAWGSGIMLYILLWLLVPEAKTSSEKLRMAGKPVTVDSLREVVGRADVKGAAARANDTLAPAINSFFRVILKIIGLGFILGGLAVIFGLIVIRVYMAAHGGQLFQENLFPIGTAEHILADLILISMGIIALFGILSGLAMFKRRWPVRGWVTGVLAGLLLVVLAGSVALAASAAPRVRDRYLSRSHTVSRGLSPFQDVTIHGKDVDYQWQYADTYSVSFHYFDNPDISKIKTSVSNNILTIDTSNYHRERNCDMLCIFPAYNLMITVRGPEPQFPTLPASAAPKVYPGSQHYFGR